MIKASQNPFSCIPAVVRPSLFLGEYESLEALQAAHPTAAVGNWAMITVDSANNQIAFWDAGESTWYILTSPSEGGSQSGITTLGTITIVDDQVTFEDFTWKYEGVDYAQAAPITRTLPFAAEGMYRTHTAYFTTTNDIDIAVGPEDDVVTTEPDIPEGTLRMRAFNVFGEVITLGPGVPAPFDLLAFDEFTGDTDGWMWIKVLGYDFKIKRSTLMAGVGGGGIPEAPNDTFGYIRKDLGWTISTLEEALKGGRNAMFTNASGDSFVIDFGTEDSPDSKIYLSIIREDGTVVFNSIFQLKTNLAELFNSFNDSSTGVDRWSKFYIDEGNAVIRKRNTYVGKQYEQSFEFEEINEADIDGTKYIVYKPKPKFVTGTYYLVDEDYVNELLEGLKTKQPVRLATTDSIFLNDVQLIDGVILVENDRVLVKDQSDAELNGIYIVKEAADWERASDANTAIELTNAVVSVLEGTANSGSTYRQVTTSITLETSDIVWQSFGSSVPDWNDSTKGKVQRTSQAEAEAIATATDAATVSHEKGMSARGLFWFWKKFFTDLVDGFSFGNLLGKITVKGEVTLEGGGTPYEHELPTRNGKLADEQYVDEANQRIYLKSSATFPYTHTITTGATEEIVLEIPIPGALLQNGSWLRPWVQNNFSTSAAGNKIIRYRISATSGTLGSLVGNRLTTSTAVNGLPLNRHFDFIDNKLYVSQNGGTSALSNISETTGSETQVAYTYATQYYFQFTVQMPTAGESIKLYSLFLEGHK